MNIQYYNSQIDFVNNEEQFLSSKEPQAAIVVLDNTEVVYGAENSCNIEWCQENNIPYIHQDKLFLGGCIVGVQGNIFLDLKDHVDGECLSDRFSKALCVFLISKGLNSVRQDNNDVLVNDYKVASGCESNINGWQYMGYQISINQDLDIINGACNKEMIKVPKGLSEFGITTEDIVNFITNYLNK